MSFEKKLYICKVIVCEVLAEPFCPWPSLMWQTVCIFEVKNIVETIIYNEIR